MNNKDILNEAIKAMKKAVYKSREEIIQEEMKVAKGLIAGKEISYSNKGITEKILTPEAVLKPVEVKAVGRPTKMTDQMKEKVIELAEEYFFIRSIAGKAGVSVDTIERELRGRSDENREGNEEFALSFAYARNKFIAFHQDLLMKYASDKREKDWRAEAHILTLCDKEFSERKYLTEAVANQDAKILMLIKAEQLTIASKEGKEMLKTVDTTLLQPETISLLPFNPQEVEKSKPKRKTVKNKGQNGSRTSSQ